MSRASQGSSDQSEDTVASWPEDRQARSPTPSSYLPQRATQTAGELAALVRPEVLAKARQAVSLGGGLGALEDREPIGDEEGGTFHLPAGYVTQNLAVSELRAASEGRALVAERLSRVLEAIGEARKIPPIKVDASGRVVDGFHRLGAAELAGVETVKVQGPKTRTAPAGAGAKTDAGPARPAALHRSAQPWQSRARRRAKGEAE